MRIAADVTKEFDFIEGKKVIFDHDRKTVTLSGTVGADRYTRTFDKQKLLDAGVTKDQIDKMLAMLWGLWKLLPEVTATDNPLTLDRDEVG